MNVNVSQITGISIVFPTAGSGQNKNKSINSSALDSPHIGPVIPCHDAYKTVSIPLLWRHNGRDGVSSHQPHDCLLNRWFTGRWKKTSKLRVTGLCAGSSPVTGEFPAPMASNAENVSIWWRHHVIFKSDRRFPCRGKWTRNWLSAASKKELFALLPIALIMPILNLHLRSVVFSKLESIFRLNVLKSYYKFRKECTVKV